MTRADEDESLRVEQVAQHVHRALRDAKKSF
mgnify:CR=1 FL=1